MPTTDTTWVVEGAKVALVTYKFTRALQRPTRFGFAEVERFTATQVVLSNGVRLNREDLSVKEGGEWRTERMVAMHPTDPRVDDASACIRSRNLAAELPKLFEDVHDLPTAVEAIVEVERQIAELRAKIGA